MRCTVWQAALTLTASLCALVQGTPAAQAQAALARSAPQADAQTQHFGPRWALRLSAGLGMGTRDLEMPVSGTVSRFETGLFPAAELGFQLAAPLGQSSALGLQVRYQSSLQHHIVERRVDGSAREQAIRAHCLDLGLTPELWLDAQGDWTLAALLGYGLCELRPLEHLLTPAYGLGGPLTRLRVQAPLWPGKLQIQVAPEAQWVLQVGHALVRQGVSSTGLGLGAEIVLRWVVGRRWNVDLAYRELWTWLDVPGGPTAQDRARFAIARLAGML